MMDMDDLLTHGSFVIERYIYKRPSGTDGVQWVVHRVEKNGELSHLIACDTRRAAAEYIAAASSGEGT